MIIDFHTHIYPDDIAEKATEGVKRFYDLEMDAVGTVAKLLERGTEAGIDRFVVQSVSTTPKQVSSINRFIAEQCERYPDRLSGLGTLHPKLEDFETALDEIESLSLKGIKLHPDFQTFDIDDRTLYPMYEMIRARALPILIHMGDFRYDFSHPRRLKKLLTDFPGLTVVGAHLGGWSVWDEALEYLLDTDCYVDTSSSLYALSPERAREIIRKYGTQRVVFGVDFPMWDPVEELERLKALKLSEDELELILHQNSLRILGI